jgi:DNA adenine methylase/adenine-specific DNA-methyltransferase
LDFTTCLDAFGGTGCVAYLFKTRRKAVTYNDILRSNYLVGTALIENTRTTLTTDDIESAVSKHPGHAYPEFIQRTFPGIYFTDEENVWLDTLCENVRLIGDRYKQALAYYALFQACIVKRPYNLFHRANLYMRTSNVERTFGNKATWDRPFDEHFRDFAAEASLAVFDSGVKCRACNKDVFDLEGSFDLVYIDTPYMNRNGTGPDYFDFYHFLEGLADYERWKERIDPTRKHLPLKSSGRCVWLDRNKVLDAFDRLFDKFRSSQLIISYRTDGIPSPEQLLFVLRRHNRTIQNFTTKGYKYVLSTNGTSKEALIVAT